MIVCGNAMRIRYNNAKYSGASHDAAVFNMSALKPQLEDDYRSGERNMLLGDAGYALKPYLLTPFQNSEEGSAESIFNKKHSQARNIVERTIGVLKNRFRCLLGARSLHYGPKKATQIINVCAALHNICISYNVKFSDEESNNNRETENYNGSEESVDAETRVIYEEAVEIRNTILEQIQLHS